MRINSSCIFLAVVLMAVGATAVASKVQRLTGFGSPMDALDREKIPAEARKTLPPDVVAVRIRLLRPKDAHSSLLDELFPGCVEGSRAPR